MEVTGRQADRQGAVDETFTGAPAAQRTMRLVQGGLRLSILVAGLIAGGSANALGLGTLHVKSALSHPLQAQIDLISPTEADLERSCYHATVNALDGTQLSKVNLEVKTDGPLPMLVLSTPQSIDEPAFALSVVYSCSSSSHREYQVLLDLMPSTPVVEATRPAATPVTPVAPVKQTLESTPQISVGTTVASADTPAKKSRHRHNGSEIVPNSAYSATPPLAGDESIEPRHKKQGTKKYRNVLKLGDDDNVDTSLDDNEGMHLRMSHGLFGSTAAGTDAPSPPVPAPAVAPAASPAPAASDQAAQPAAQATPPAPDLNLQVLQTKIRLLEAQTEELRKLNAIQQAKLDAAQAVKSDRTQLLSLYFLLFLSFIAIVWLVWRMRQIESDITDSHWHHIVPEEDEAQAQTEAQVVTQTRTAQNDDDDSFLDEPRKPDPSNVKPLKPLPKLVAVDKADLPFDTEMENEPVVPVPALPSESRPKAEASEREYKSSTPARAALPDAEEILDEIQQAEFWMEMHQPERAIEILESNWGADRPNSPLPWLYLLDLYKQTNDRSRYEELTARFEHIFNGRVGGWEDKSIDPMRSLEDFPAVLNKIVQLWPSPDIVPYMENLLIDDRDGRRQGFELSAYRDILFLTNIAYAVQDEGESKAAHTAPEWSLLN
jgi:hypothetical protein